MSEKLNFWEDLGLFVAVAREGGLSSASRVTGRSAATLGRRMRALERSIGKELFIRHTHGYTLTEQAEQLLTELLPVEATIARLGGDDHDDALPLVKLSAGTWTTLGLVERLDEIIGSPADVRLRFVSGEAVLSIPRREVVIGFRNQRPDQHGLAGRRLRRVEFAPYALPDAPDRWVSVTIDTPSAHWMSRSIDNSKVVCEVNSPRTAMDLALAGKGIALLPTFVGDAESSLIRKGDTIEELAHDQWIVVHQDDRKLAEVRRTVDRLFAVLA